MLYFVVRTDITAEDGLQRVFGVFDARAQAEAFIGALQARMRGEFTVYQGSPAENMGQGASPEVVAELKEAFERDRRERAVQVERSSSGDRDA